MMNTLLLLLLFFLGASFGSFFLLIGMRLPLKQPIAFARSRCSHCDTHLQVLDLFPLLSYLFLRARCRFCGHRFSAAHFWFELAGGFILLVLYTNHSSHPAELLYHAAVYAVLFIMAAVDVQYLYFPDRFQLLLLLLLLYKAYSEKNLSWHNLSGVMLIFLLLFLTETMVPGGLGGGDKKLLAIWGVTIGLQPTLIILFWASVACLIAFGWRQMKFRPSCSSSLPFGPFLAVAFFLVQEGVLPLL